MIKAIQYKVDNLAQMIEILCLEPSEINVNYGNQSLKLGMGNSKKVSPGEWVVLLDSGIYQVVVDEVAQKIIEAWKQNG